jgi:catechol 2,3-dioxygenase
LKVANLERAVRFYEDIMGFDLLMNMGTAAFLSAGGYHHHLGLNTWESLNGSPAPQGTTGMYHYAINYPTRKDLAVALVRILESGWGIDGASDHGTHEALYMHDPDFNGMELAWDRTPEEWPRKDGKIVFSRKPLDFTSLLAELGGQAPTHFLESLAKYD